MNYETQAAKRKMKSLKAKALENISMEEYNCKIAALSNEMILVKFHHTSPSLYHSITLATRKGATERILQ